PNAVKQIPLSRTTIEFLKQSQRQRSLQKRIGAGSLTVLEGGEDLIVRESRGVESPAVQSPTIADCGGQAVRRGIGGDAESSRQPVAETAVANVDHNRRRSCSLV